MMLVDAGRPTGTLSWGEKPSMGAVPLVLFVDRSPSRATVADRGIAGADQVASAREGWRVDPASESAHQRPRERVDVGFVAHPAARWEGDPCWLGLLGRRQRASPVPVLVEVVSSCR